MNHPRNVGILIFDEVEVLDFCGPFEVFSVANRESESPVFHVFTVAETNVVEARGGLHVNRKYALADCPELDILLAPGGAGVRREVDNKVLTNWITSRAAESPLTASVCTGAVLLGRCGLLDGLEATTHHQCIEQLREAAPLAHVRTGRRFIDAGHIITSAGISAGIDMSLHIVSRLLGSDFARAVAKRMEYPWESDETTPLG